MTVPTTTDNVIAAKFTIEDAHRASDEWGFNCGPAAVAAILGMTLAGLRPHLGDFETKHYTNPTLMWSILRSLKAPVSEISRLNASLESQRRGEAPWPFYGLARVQWEGPWTAPGVPVRVRYRHTHWVGVSKSADSMTAPGWEEPRIFDVNCMSMGGWVPLSMWTESVVPWILKQCEPKADGKWHLTHTVEIERAPNK